MFSTLWERGIPGFLFLAFCRFGFFSGWSENEDQDMGGGHPLCLGHGDGLGIDKWRCASFSFFPFNPTFFAGNLWPFCLFIFFFTSLFILHSLLVHLLLSFQVFIFCTYNFSPLSLLHIPPSSWVRLSVFIPFSLLFARVGRGLGVIGRQEPVSGNGMGNGEASWLHFWLPVHARFFFFCFC
ncbi:hypothetical protein B0J18DRAFT_154733 [Chaetomium sp. MPI-SDFR-AT-0129]|nr:hypothetical protein B0J18DRAFT_154733 [Chaetomium sp. MPI-SDFR-AT-0129]